MDEEPPLPDSKLTRSKQRWADEHKFLTGMVTRPEDQRLPPGQHLVKNWPVLDLGRTPDIRNDRWRLKVTGMVERPLDLDWSAFMAMPQKDLRSDITTRDLLEAVQPRDEVEAVMLHGYDD